MGAEHEAIHHIGKLMVVDKVQHSWDLSQHRIQLQHTIIPWLLEPIESQKEWTEAQVSAQLEEVEEEAELEKSMRESEDELMEYEELVKDVDAVEGVAAYLGNLTTRMRKAGLAKQKQDVAKHLADLQQQLKAKESFMLENQQKKKQLWVVSKKREILSQLQTGQKFMDIYASI